MASTAPFDIGTLIHATAGVYGGRPCLKGTRFPILSVAVHYREGMSAEEIASDYEGLDLASVYARIAYNLANREAIDAELAEEHRQYLEALAADRAAQAARGLA